MISIFNTYVVNIFVSVHPCSLCYTEPKDREYICKTMAIPKE